MSYLSLLYKENNSIDTDTETNPLRSTPPPIFPPTERQRERQRERSSSSRASVTCRRSSRSSPITTHDSITSRGVSCEDFGILSVIHLLAGISSTLSASYRWLNSQVSLSSLLNRLSSRIFHSVQRLERRVSWSELGVWSFPRSISLLFVVRSWSFRLIAGA